jgi:hypothetical protein
MISRTLIRDLANCTSIVVHEGLRERMPRVHQARSNSLVCDHIRSAFLSKGSLGHRACERLHDNSHGGTTDPGRSRAPGPLLAADSEAGLYLGKPCRLPIAGRAQRQAPTRGGGRVLSRGDSRRAPRAPASSQAKNHQTDRTPPRGEWRSPQHRCHPRSTSTRGLEGGRS